MHVASFHFLPARKWGNGTMEAQKVVKADKTNVVQKKEAQGRGEKC